MNIKRPPASDWVTVLFAEWTILRQKNLDRGYHDELEPIAKTNVAVGIAVRPE